MTALRAEPPLTTDRPTPKLVGVVWALLLVNTLGYTKVDMLVPIPKGIAQVVTMGALTLAFALALVLNPRIRLRPSAYLVLLSLLVLLSVVTSLQLESGAGSLLRCFRFVVFVATLWLLSTWWRGDVTHARFHIRTLLWVLLSVVLGLVASPGAALGGPDGRLVGVIWPIPAPQVGLYCATAIGLTALLWITGRTDRRSALLIAVPALALLLLTHTRTALLGLVLGLVVALLSLARSQARARRALSWAAGVGVVAAVFWPLIAVWLQRGQDSEELSNLTGRSKVWDQLLADPRTLGQQLFGVGLTDKTYGGLPIDSTWYSVYNEQGWVGISIVVAFLAVLIVTAVLRPPSAERACAVFLIVYSLSATYTEVGLGDASPYLINLAVAASLLAAPRRRADVGLIEERP
jgi:hypothetical protein